MEQIVRDTRIAQIYEGANGIQALDLLGRKVVRNEGKYMLSFIEEIRDYVASMTSEHRIKDATLRAADRLADLTRTVVDNSKTQPSDVNGCAVDYMHAAGYLCYAYMFAMMVEAADGKTGDFYRQKAKLADYFVARILPRLYAHADMVDAGSAVMMDFALSYFDETL